MNSAPSPEKPSIKSDWKNPNVIVAIIAIVATVILFIVGEMKIIPAYTSDKEYQKKIIETQQEVKSSLLKSISEGNIPDIQAISLISNSKCREHHIKTEDFESSAAIIEDLMVMVSEDYFITASNKKNIKDTLQKYLTKIKPTSPKKRPQTFSIKDFYFTFLLIIATMFIIVSSELRNRVPGIISKEKVRSYLYSQLIVLSLAELLLLYSIWILYTQ